jgi:C4-dicarboxylate transporter
MLVVEEIIPIISLTQFRNQFIKISTSFGLRSRCSEGLRLGFRFTNMVIGLVTGSGQTAEGFSRLPGIFCLHRGLSLRVLSFWRPYWLMKSPAKGFLLAFLMAAAVTSSAVAQSGAFTVVERGPDYNVLQRTTAENGTNVVHR